MAALFKLRMSVKMPGAAEMCILTYKLVCGAEYVQFAQFSKWGLGRHEGAE